MVSRPPAPGRVRRAPCGVASAAVLGLLLLASAPALAFRCGTHIVTEGLHKVEVLERCGVPVLRDVFALHAHPALPRRLPAHLQHRLPVVQVEEWLYDLGPHRFRRLVRFENGYVVAIDVLTKPLR